VHAASQGRPKQHIDVIIDIVMVRRILNGAPLLQADEIMQLLSHLK
jgi:hypothetical protein